MKAIHKYNVGKGGGTVTMPHGAEVLSAQVQHGLLCVWAVVDLEVELTEERVVRVYTTGEHGEFPGEYAGTVQFNEGTLVLHVFVEI